MNRRIFSLVCIALYALLDALIYCSEQKYNRSKTSGLKNRIICAVKKINRSYKKNGIESKRETQLNNNNNNHPKYGDDGYYYGDNITVTKCWGCCGNKHADDE
ncbi:fam-c protein [Plasmodium vinckei brucechwatti]|uniref:Fam-c protein n=1 Tax=Plasmodium vinckei brucechwatti TaxID=119398 RepID=A0A6V7RWN8_PLAVN|nr:fam-c protein [Plasmodium vinckei brucechwatti]